MDQLSDTSEPKRSVENGSDHTMHFSNITEPMSATQRGGSKLNNESGLKIRKRDTFDSAQLEDRSTPKAKTGLLGAGEILSQYTTSNDFSYKNSIDLGKNSS